MRFLGHPVHPIVVAFPIALLALTPVWDGVALLGIENLAPVAYWTELAGLVGGGLAVVTGIADFIGLKAPSPELTNAALRHATFALTALSLFGIAIAIRGGPSGDPTFAVVGLEVLGALALGVTGWMGGHLVFRYGVGVDER